MGLALDKVGKEVLGTASKIVLTKDTTTIVGDGSTQEAVNKRVAQIKNLIEVIFSLPYCFLPWIFLLFCWRTVCANIKHLSLQVAEQDYEKEKLSERIAKLSGGVAVIQVDFQLP